MRGWNECPQCWGTGLVGGFSVPCDLNNSSVEVVFALLDDIEDELEQVEHADHDDVLKAAVRVVVGTLLRTMHLKVVDRG